MPLEVRINHDTTSKATTWVFEAPPCSLPYFGEALEGAVRKGLFLGIHKTSRHVIAHWAEPQTMQNSKSKLEGIFGRAGANNVSCKVVQIFDMFHAEQWGLVVMTSPHIPHSSSRIVEEDDLESGEEDVPNETSEESIGEEGDVEESPEGLVLRPVDDLFSLVRRHRDDVAAVRVPGIVRALSLDTLAEKELRQAFEHAGGPLSAHLETVLFPRGKHHVEAVQEEARVLARKRASSAMDCIAWLTSPPECITVCDRVCMHPSRRVAWIVWKAKSLDLELTLPVFMAFFKQITHYTSSKARMEGFKTVVMHWKGSKLDLKELPADVRNLVLNINDGRNDCYCSHCNRVINPQNPSKFCSPQCSSEFCKCGERFKTRWVTDSETLEQKQRALGPYFHLVDLALMLSQREEVSNFRTPSDVYPKFEELTRKRKEKKCCDAVEGLMDRRWCKDCLREFQHLTTVSKYVELVSSGRVTWGHCQEAADRLETLRTMPLPQMEEKYCDRPHNKYPRRL